jgi:hypothetical protein
MLNHKKILSLALAGAMAASLAVPACAATSSNTTKVTATYQPVTIDVVVPTTGTTIINPYGLPVDIGPTGTVVQVKGAQLVNKPMLLKNKTSTKLNVSVSATASVTGAFTFATAAIEDFSKDTKNDGFVYLAFAANTELTGAETALTDAAVATAYSKVTWPEYDEEKNIALKATTTAITKSDVAVLGAATMDTTDTTKFSAYTADSIVYFGMCGQVSQTPKTAWVAKDGFVANIAFTFTPNTET